MSDDGEGSMGEQWEVEGHYVMACNCDYGCPCNFNAPPTPGFCEGVVAFIVSGGNYGDVDLAGTKVAAIAKWPGAIHEGGGTASIYLNASATEEQQHALGRIISGDEGGTFGMIMKNTMDSLDGPHLAEIEADIDGKNTVITIEDRVRIEFESIKNPVTGAESFPRVVLPQGVWSNELEQFTTKEFRAGDGPLEMDHTGKVAQIAEIHWQGP